MKKITINKVNEDIYYEKLDNGLEVYFYINPTIHNNYVTYTTKYGSIYKEFTPINEDKMINVPNGIAHFLEHKVFVQEIDPQPEEFFAQNGALCNAYTTFKNTTYLFSGPDNLKENINYLLDYVSSLYLTEENVESEKNIIIQEINMCNDRPTDILYDMIRKNTIKNNPFKESIIGTAKEVKSITKELLETCYNTFYNSSNMFLVVTGNFDKDEILEAIKENQSKKNQKEIPKIEVKKYKEPDKIVKEKEIIKCNTNIPKVAYSVKINVDKLKVDKRKLNVYMYLLYTLLFGDTSNFDEKMKKQGIITSTLYYNFLDIGSHFILSLINSCYEYEKLIKEIEKITSNITIDKNEFERKKKVLISNEIFSYENVEMINDMIIDNILFDGTIYEDTIGMINSLNVEELEKIIKEIDWNNKSIVILDKNATTE